MRFHTIHYSIMHLMGFWGFGATNPSSVISASETVFSSSNTCPLYTNTKKSVSAPSCGCPSIANFLHCKIVVFEGSEISISNFCAVLFCFVDLFSVVVLCITHQRERERHTHRDDIDDERIEIGVHIADVTSFLFPDTAMDEEAARRGTTTYLVQRRLDMLPGALTMMKVHICWVIPNSRHSKTYTFHILKIQFY